MSACSIVKIPPPDGETLWLKHAYGIRHDEEFDRYDPRNVLEKTLNYAQVLGHGAEYTAEAITKRLIASARGLVSNKFDDQTPIGKADSLGLVILFHGLHGQPSLWDYHVEELNSFVEFDILPLEVPEAGVCSLDDPPFEILLNRIVKWTEEHPLKPIAFFGQSNGSRVAAYYETLLRERAPTTPVHVSLTGGVLYGSLTINAVALHKWHDYFEGYNIYQDLAFGSKAAKALLAKVRAPLKEGVAERYYTMYAPYYDHHVYSLGSALPIINSHQQPTKKERHYVVFNYGHNAIPIGVMDKQIHKCIKWMTTKAIE